LPRRSQGIYPGVLESAYRRELQSLISRNALARLWGKDASLWPAEQHEAETLKSNLFWLDLPEQLGALVTRVAARAAEIEPAGFEDVVFVTLGSSSLAAEAALRLPSARLGKRTFLLDHIDPDGLQSLEANLRLEKTLFIFASKTGKDIDAHSLLLYFLDRLRVLGISSATSHFVALAQEDSYLGQLAVAYQFIDRFLDPPGIHGRYSSLIHFTFFLAAVGHLDARHLLARVRSMCEACGPKTSGEANPAISLGAFLTAAEVEGFGRLVFFSPNTLQPPVHRIGYLVGASTCKGGRGIVPVFGGASYPLEMLRRGCLVACLRMAGEEGQELEKKCGALQEAGIPVVTIELNGPEDLSAELFKWEIATALACSSLGVNPFLDPDTQDSRAGAANLLEQISDKGQLPSPTVRVREADIELYAEGETRRELSTLNMLEALRSFFALAQENGYLALLPFMDLNPARFGIFRRISDHLEMRLGIPGLVTGGPRYLHTLAQVYHGGPAKGLFLLVTANPARDLAIPGAKYSFGQLQLALALADFESLGRQGRPVIRLHLARGAEQGLVQLETILNNAPGNRRPATS
jgi:transaldolase / glucose-6-phosphate isomerase